MARVLVTGATGFVGSHLVPVLLGAGCVVVATLRSARADVPAGVEAVTLGDLTDLPDLRPLLDGVDAVVHLAARAHQVREGAAAAEDAFREANAVVTRHLAAQAAAAGVRRMVFLSSIKVNGESTPERPFTEGDPPAPEDAYGRSKLAAELALREVAKASGLEMVIIRPPLVYGPGVKGNFLRLLALVGRGVPLPLRAVDNRRSLLGVWNLCDLVLSCLRQPSAAGEVFLAADDEPLSTPALVRSLATAMGRPARLVPIPPALLRLAARAIGRGGEAARLTGSLEVDASRARRLLDWKPSVAAEEGLARTAHWYLRAGSAR